MKKVIVIAGPTASGKTSLSIKIAKKLNLEIINGDSVAIYKRLDIGSAKATKEEMDGVVHHLIDIKNPGEEYTVYDYQQDVRKLIDKIDVPMIVGGSGFYIKSSLYNYEFNKEKKVKTNLTQEEKILYIKKHDPSLEFDESNPRRVDRMYEMLKNKVKPSKKTKKDEPLYDILVLYLDMPRKYQKGLMEKRLEIMFEKGFLEEVKSLREDGIYINDIIGYRELNDYLDGKISLKEAKQKIIRTTLKFSKRQKTWFLNQEDPVILDPLDPNLLERSITIIKEFLNE